MIKRRMTVLQLFGGYQKQTVSCNHADIPQSARTQCLLARSEQSTQSRTQMLSYSAESNGIAEMLRPLRSNSNTSWSLSMLIPEVGFF